MFCISACLSACSDSDKTAQLLVTLDTQVISSIAPVHWVYATDADGNLLDIKKTTGQERLVLTTTRPIDHFNLTIVSASGQASGAPTYLNIETYADVDRGSTFEARYGVGFTLRDPVSVAFKLNGYDGPPQGVWFTNRGSHTNYQETIAGGTLHANLLMGGLPSDVLLTTYRHGAPVYAKIQGVKGGDQIELDMNANFTPFEHQRKLNFDGYNSANVAGAYLDSSGKIASLYFDILDTDRLAGSQDATDQPLIGYIDGFDIYQMNLVNYQTSGAVAYHKQGNLASSFESFTMPTFTFKVLDTNLPRFTYEFSEDFTYYTASFTYDAGIAFMHWTIYAPQGKQVKIGNIPADIAAVYPMLQPEAFRYGGCELTKGINGYTYKESILRRQHGQADEFEYYVFIPHP